jgi:uncharacterized membrane protein YfcA
MAIWATCSIAFWLGIAVVDGFDWFAFLILCTITVAVAPLGVWWGNRVRRRLEARRNRR